MNDERLPNIHPGEILHIEFLEPLQITPYRTQQRYRRCADTDQ